MRYFLTEKSNGKQVIFSNEEDAQTYVDFCQELGERCILRCLICLCTTNFTFEDEKIIFKAEKDD